MQSLIVRSNKPARRRRWASFSLRTLLVLVTLLCIYLGRLQYLVHRDYQAVTELLNRGYRVTFADRGTSVDTPDRLFLGRILGPAWGSYGLDVSVEATKDTHTDDIPLIMTIHRLKGLLVRGPAVGDAELRELVSNRTIKGLVLDHCKVTDEGFKELIDHREIEHLLFRGMWMSDAAIIQFYNERPNCYLRFNEFPFAEHSIRRQ